MKGSHEDIPADLQQLAAAIEEQRPRLTDAEFDRVKRRVLAGDSRMAARSRQVIIALLTAGLLLTGGGAALGISALTTSDDASIAQYGPAPTGTTPQQGVLGDVQRGGNGEKEDSLGAGEESDVRAQEQFAAQPTRQLAAEGNDELPFTGYAAIPMLLLGVSLLAAGLLLRRPSTLRESRRL